MFEGLVVDNFAGGGGASLGLELGLGRAVDIAVNHDSAAIAMHSANHPRTLHLCEDVWAVDPVAVTAGRPVDVAWFSPDCKHFSRAKGGKPVEKKIRGLAWVAVKWARLVRPKVIFLENVREFEDWGPLTSEMRPDVARKGRTFRRFVSTLVNMGYEVQWRSLNAADYGAPTNRRRLFLIARCDGGGIVWPEVTHGARGEWRRAKGEGVESAAGDGNGHAEHRRAAPVADGGAADRRDRERSVRGDRRALGSGAVNLAAAGDGALKPYRTAAECIDWSIPCPSIFERSRALALKTCARLAMGVLRFVIDNPAPFIVRCQHGGDEFRGQSIDEPLGTVTAKHGYGVVDPSVTAASEAAPYMVSGYGERAGQEPRAQSIESPTGAVVASAKHRLVAAFLAKHFGGVVGHGVAQPLGTVTAVDHHSVVEAEFSGAVIGVGGRAGQSAPHAVDAPMGTSTAKADRAIVIVRTGQQSSGCGVHGASESLSTIVSKAEHCVVEARLQSGRVDRRIADIPAPPELGGKEGAAFIAKHNHGDEHQSSGVESPLSVVTTQSNKFSVVSARLAFLMKYYGTGGQWQTVSEPLHTSTGKARFGVVNILVDTSDLVGVVRVGRFLEKFVGAVDPYATEPRGKVELREKLRYCRRVRMEQSRVFRPSWMRVGKRGVVAVAAAGGGEWPRLLSDLGMRMFTPRELARAQGFPDSYVLTGSKASQVARIGNSVCPVMAEVLSRANCGDIKSKECVA